MACELLSFLLAGVSAYILLVNALQFGELLALGAQTCPQILAVLFQAGDFRLFHFQPPFAVLEVDPVLDEVLQQVVHAALQLLRLLLEILALGLESDFCGKTVSIQVKG